MVDDLFDLDQLDDTDPFEIDRPQAGPALVEMLLDLMTVRRRELVVDEDIDPLEDQRAVDVMVLAAAHDVTSGSSSSCRTRPRSLA